MYWTMKYNPTIPKWHMITPRRSITLYQREYLYHYVELTSLSNNFETNFGTFKYWVNPQYMSKMKHTCKPTLAYFKNMFDK